MLLNVERVKGKECFTAVILGERGKDFKISDDNCFPSFFISNHFLISSKSNKMFKALVKGNGDDVPKETFVNKENAKNNEIVPSTSISKCLRTLQFLLRMGP